MVYLIKYSKTCLKRPLKKNIKIGFKDQLKLNAGQKYCRILQGEHSAIFSTFIKVPFVINILVLSIFQWQLKTGFTVHGVISLTDTTLYEKLIRIYHECEGRKEKSGMRITVWHHKACQKMTNGDPEEWIFLSYSHPNNGFFFLLTIRYQILFIRKGYQKFLNTPRCDML